MWTCCPALWRGWCRSCRSWPGGDLSFYSVDAVDGLYYYNICIYIFKIYTYTYIYIYSKKMFCLSIGKNGGAPPDLAAAFWETKPRMRSSCKHGRLIVGNQIAHHCAIVSGVVSVHVVGNLGQPDTELFRIPSHKRAPTSWEAWHLLLMYDDVLFWLVQSGPPRQTNWLETL
jgi:hypothetical protein